LFQIWFHIELFLITNPTVPRLHFSDIFFYAKVYFYFFIRKKKLNGRCRPNGPAPRSASPRVTRPSRAPSSGRPQLAPAPAIVARDFRPPCPFFEHGRPLLPINTPRSSNHQATSPLSLSLPHAAALLLLLALSCAAHTHAAAQLRSAILDVLQHCRRGNSIFPSR
jgi:hypothetical protein